MPDELPEKPWYRSKTTIASIITIAVGVLTTFGVIHIGPVQIENVPAEVEGISQAVVGIIGMVLGAIALWGRITAKTKITK